MDDLSSFSTENLKLSKITANYDHVKYIWNIFEALDNFLVQETRNFFKEKSPCNTRQIMSSLIINCKEKNTFWAYEVNKMLETIFGISREEALVYYSKLVHSQSSHSALQSSSLLSSYSTCDQLFPSHSGHINDQPYQIKNIYHASYLEKSRDTSVSDSIIKNPIHDNEATTEKADDKGVNFIDSTNDLRNTVMESSSSFQSFNSKFYSTKNHQAVFDILIKVLAASLVGHGYDARMSALLDTIIRQWLDDHHVVMDQIESSLIQQITQTCGIDGEDDVGGATTQKHMEAQHLSATTSKRNMLVGVGAVVGGVALGMSAGFAVPVLMPMIAALFGATSSASAVIGISSLFGVLFGAGGAGFTGYRVHSRYRDVKEFKFNRICVNSRIRVFLGVSGWITCDEDITNPWEFVTFRDTYALEVEKQAFMDLGTAIRDFLMSTAVSSFTISVLKTTALATAVGAIVWPMAVIQTGLIIDNPWAVCINVAYRAGLILADAIRSRAHGSRPITLVGYSIGALIILRCLVDLSRDLDTGLGIVDNVLLCGLPTTISDSVDDWVRARLIVSGRLVHGYSDNDWMLKFLFRGTTHATSNIAGLSPISVVSGIENVNLSDLITGHLDYSGKMPHILDLLQFP